MSYSAFDQERFLDEPAKRAGRTEFMRDRARVIHPARAQSVRTLKSEKVWCAENHFPKELLLVSLQLIVEERLSELHVRDHA